MEQNVSLNGNGSFNILKATLFLINQRGNKADKVPPNAHEK